MQNSSNYFENHLSKAFCILHFRHPHLEYPHDIHVGHPF